ncbi:MAG: Vitamin B12 dependent methionine synthase activation subunit [Ruminococcus sp.]|nr:Vitamin B12 dependent methionine synthase activation subunit [Ruminococcus sp.]
MIPYINRLSADIGNLCVPIKDIIRYSGCRQSEDEKLCSLCKDALEELCPFLNPRAVYAEVPVSFAGDIADFGFCKYESTSLRKFLGGDCTVYIFAATVGIGADRLISRYSSILPSRAVITDGCATAAIECFCDYICRDVFHTNEQERFSPGYGDLPLEMQRDIMEILDASINIGLSMTDSYLLTPTKSVTAIVKSPCQSVTDIPL